MITRTTCDSDLKIGVRGESVVLSMTEKGAEEPYIEVPLTGRQAILVATNLISMARRVGL